MDTRDTIEIGALLSAHSLLLLESPVGYREAAVRSTWRLGRERVSHWLRRLHDAGDTGGEVGALAAAEVARELLTEDVLARVWIGLIRARAERTSDPQLASVANNLLLGRLRARRFVMQWLLDDPQLEETVLRSIDRLRRRTERWTDLLLAPLVGRHDLADIVFDLDRCREFARDEIAEAAADPTSNVWQLLVAGIRVAFDDLPNTDATRRANRQFTSAVLGCLPTDAFEENGTFRSLPVARIRRSGTRMGGHAAEPGVDLLLAILPRHGQS